MHAAISAAPAVAPDAGLSAAIILAAGVTALVALIMMGAALHRHRRFSLPQLAGTVALALGVVAVSTVGVLAVSPDSAQASDDDTPPGIRYVVEPGPDIQLPTLADD